MTWQLVIVGVAVAAAGFYLARQAWLTWSGGKSGCGGGCGCADERLKKESAPLISPEELLSRLKRTP